MQRVVHGADRLTAASCLSDPVPTLTKACVVGAFGFDGEYIAKLDCVSVTFCLRQPSSHYIHLYVRWNEREVDGSRLQCCTIYNQCSDCSVLPCSDYWRNRHYGVDLRNRWLLRDYPTACETSRLPAAVAEPLPPTWCQWPTDRRSLECIPRPQVSQRQLRRNIRRIDQGLFLKQVCFQTAGEQTSVPTIGGR